MGLYKVDLANLSLLLLLCFFPLGGSGRRTFARFQRGDQGPDDSSGASLIGGDVTPPRGGPNVCWSNSLSFCCPGWSQRGFSGLCLTPLCPGDCSSGRCVKPGVCLCPKGRMAPTCLSTDGNRNSSSSSGCSSTCLNGGTCSEETGECVCRPGYAGEFCQEPVCHKECENGGRCIGPNRCACVYGYTGRYCEIDYRTGPCYRRTENDLCTGQLEGVVCTRQLCCATIGVAWGHPCEKCPDTLACQPGFLKNVHTGKCMDINECEAIPGLCDGGECVNSVGSFECVCPEGKAMNEDQACVDLDECADEICPNGRCINRDPGYYCLCNPGFIPSQDQKMCLDARQGSCYSEMAGDGSCSGKLQFRLSRLDCCCSMGVGLAWGAEADDCQACPQKGSDEFEELCLTVGNFMGHAITMNECRVGGEDVCQHGDCVDTPEGYRCDCYHGYRNDVASGVCVDIDECLVGGQKCYGGRCVNTPGSFECVCPPGRHPSPDGRRCLVGGSCGETGACANGVCAPGGKCICSSGYELVDASETSCRDVDECAENAGVCLRGRCLNTPGSYVCQCDDGYELSPAGGYCADRNECVEYRRGGDGRELCENGVCVNTEGGYRCVCDPGYELSHDGRRCEDIDECFGVVCANGDCINTPGGFECRCRDGFALGPDGRTCIDTVLAPCYALVRNGRCLNSLGGGSGGRLVSKSSCCCAVNAGAPLGWGHPCDACPLPGSLTYIQLCPHGPGVTNAGDDINECALNAGADEDETLCSNGACENLVGSFRCVCDPGYEPDATGRSCRDLNECKLGLFCGGGGQCRNTPGSYRCICPKGTVFEDKPSVCRDVDECASESNNNVCGPNGRCVNTHGSFACECADGYAPDSSARRCSDQRRGSCWRKSSGVGVGVGIGVGVDGPSGDRCEGDLPSLTLRSECCCSGLGVAWGSPCEMCDLSVDCDDCRPGFARSGDKNNSEASCTDVNECELDPHLCQGGACINTEGSYVCRCPPGLSLDSSGMRCVDDRVEPCYLDFRLGVCSKDVGGMYKRDRCCCTIGEGWGHKCSQCPRPGSQAFEELCTKGLGIVEDVDVNECLAFPDVCRDGRCKNSVGSYSCRCNQGYALDEKGVSCVNIDECDIMFGVCGNGTCIDTPGSFRCDCHEGFEVKPFMQVCMDINECEETPGLCRGGRCINTPGSYHCECPLGHELSKDRRSCKDIDECSLTSGICSNGVCENMLGAYQCVCDEGFEQSANGKSCTDVDECKEDNGGCDDMCMNTPGSYSCTCSSGYMLLIDGKTCEDVDECAVDHNENAKHASALTPCNGGKCVNTPGSYSCVCSGGLRMATDGSSCLDLDECVINPDVCKHGKCENTPGSFRCLCDDGYSPAGPDPESGCVDDDECALHLYHCHPEADCRNTNGSYECTCRKGFTGDGFECQDINECLTDNGGCSPHAACHNIPGSRRCVCDRGYDGDGVSCADIDECAEDPALCANGVCLNRLGSFVCECQMGYMHPDPDDQTACVDVDECAAHDVCKNGVCENVDGFFRCLCNPGYTLDDTGGNCTDVDECSDALTCQYGDCVNTDGGFECVCPENYDLVEEKGNGCVDKRIGVCYREYDITTRGYPACGNPFEASVSRSTCCCSAGVAWGPTCERCPVSGSPEHRQLCPGGRGFRPNPDTVVLEDVNECVELGNVVCENGRCTNTFGSYMCTCSSGYSLDDQRVRCVDIDECAEDQGPACGAGTCVNNPGGFECVCPTGYAAGPGGRGCVDTRRGACYLDRDCSDDNLLMTSRPQTRVVCCCSLGGAWDDGIRGCVSCPGRGSDEWAQLCGAGEAPAGMIIDPETGGPTEIDECSLMPGMCQHGTCVNTVGSFTCLCSTGYVYDDASHQCIDDNECLTAVCAANARCVNTPGSYRCECPPGYRPGDPDPARRSAGCLDVDECTERRNVCQRGTCRNVAGGFQCVCQEGFTLTTSKDSCMDMDECSLNPSLCGNGTCVNTFGSFRCHCHYGFQVGANGDCEDVDECRIRYDLCRHGRCVNSRGSFRCECADGFRPNPADGGHSCQDIDECLTKCREPGKCRNLLGTFSCECPEGYRLSTAGDSCIDVNECREIEDYCIDGFCRNREGGAVCECPDGWVLQSRNHVTSNAFTSGINGFICVDARLAPCFSLAHQAVASSPSQSSHQGSCGSAVRANGLEVSRLECCCTGGAIWGDPSKGIRCQRCPSKGSRALSELCRISGGKDFNECVLRAGEVCLGGGTCINVDGGYRCQCPEGYTVDQSGNKCIDKDECAADPGICGNGSCANVAGSFECQCAEGYAPGPKGTCEDVDECREYGHQCAFRCHNLPGSYRCVCPFGYELAPDGRHCRDVDECSAPNGHACRYECKNLIGSHACVCPEGYRKVMGADDQCQDVDECSQGEELCGKGRCVNTPGGYRCDCPPGYETSEDGRGCLDRRLGRCFKRVFNGRCPAVEVSLTGAPKVTKENCCCVMGAAWGEDCELCPARGSRTFNSLCLDPGLGPEGQDIDECSTLPDLCANGLCLNTLGSFRCICDRGFKPDRQTGTICVDVDECATGVAKCQHECHNTRGSYRCSCPSGYILAADDRTCRDIDECSTGDHRCEHECVNTLGSFSCVCPPGFVQLGDRCVDADECVEQPGLCPPPGTCKNTRGSFKCVCPRGYRLDGTGTFCVDTNECEASGGANKCQDAECKNVLGSYKCGCPQGFAFHAYLGQCEDRNECVQGGDNGADTPCGNARCQNSIGGFACTCPTGYQYNEGLRICVQASLGCSRASCTFGCQSLGPSDYTCGCPSGYQALGGSHCVAPNNPESLLASGGRFEFLQEGVEQDPDVLTTEGCFACHEANNAPKRRRIGRKYRRRGGNYNRRNRRDSGSSSRPEALHVILKELDPTSWSQGRYKRSSESNEVAVLRLRKKDTWHKRRILFLQAARSDLEGLSYHLGGRDASLFQVKPRDGIWGLFYKKGVHQKYAIHQLSVFSQNQHVAGKDQVEATSQLAMEVSVVVE